MAGEESGKTDYVRSQNERLGYFLVANAFLIAAFIQLITANSSNGIITEKVLLILVNAVAALGGLISALYAFMNSWDRHKNGGHVLHTIIIPLFSLVFWILAWIVVDIQESPFWWCSILIIILFIVGCYLVQKNREENLFKSCKTKIKGIKKRILNPSDE